MIVRLKIRQIKISTSTLLIIVIVIILCIYGLRRNPRAVELRSADSTWFSKAVIGGAGLVVVVVAVGVISGGRSSVELFHSGECVCVKFVNMET